MRHSVQSPPILFFIFLLIFIVEFPIKNFFWDPFIFYSYEMTRPH